MYQLDPNPRLFFDVTASGDGVDPITIADLSLTVHRPGLANSAALSLSLATDPTSTTIGAVYSLGGGQYWVNVETSLIATYAGPIAVQGTYVDGSVVGVVERVTAYDPTGDPATNDELTTAINGLSQTISDGMRIDLSQTTPDGNTVGEILDSILGELGDSNAAFGGVSANGQWPEAAINPSEFVAPAGFYSTDTWYFYFDIPTDIPAGEELVLSLKSSDGDLREIDDANAELEVVFEVGGVASVTVLNESSAPRPGDATVDYGPAVVDPNDGQTKSGVVITIADDTTAAIADGTYRRGLKRVGLSRHLIYDTVAVIDPIIQKIAPD